MHGTERGCYGLPLGLKSPICVCVCAALLAAAVLMSVRGTAVLTSGMLMLCSEMAYGARGRIGTALY